MNFCRPFFQPLSQMLSKSLAVGVITSVGLLSGLSPGLSGRSGILFLSSNAYAQTAVSNEEVTNYSRAVLLIEPARQTALNEVKEMVHSDAFSRVRCDKQETISALPENAQRVVVKYCTTSNSIIKSNGLDSHRFNEITTLYQSQSDPDLNRRIHNELIRLQSESP